ncbi:MAG: hypothetical protein AB1641_03385 [Thermodesulfobacteriota bacterium]
MPWSPLEDRSIIHLNVADFAVAVERVVDRRLRSRPVVVAAAAAARSVVYDMSDEAYRSGVRKGMALRRALKLCREARIVPPHPDRYERAMAALLERVGPYSPLIEAEERTGHLFLDATGTSRLFGPAVDLAWRLRRTVKNDLGLDPIWSVAPNKLVAKVATRLVKPSGEYIVEAGEEEEFLRPLPVVLLPGLEREDLLRLREFNVRRVAELARWGPEQLEVVFGRRGPHLYRAARGQDSSPVLPAGRKRPEVRLDHEFADDANDTELVESALYRLTERAGFELRERGQVARRVALTIDYSDGRRAAGQRSAGAGTAGDFKLFALAQAALESAWRRRIRLRHLRLICDRLTFPPGQLDLFPEDDESAAPPESLLAALDEIRRRFGSHLIGLGRAQAAAA